MLGLIMGDGVLNTTLSRLILLIINKAKFKKCIRHRTRIFIMTNCKRCSHISLYVMEYRTISNINNMTRLTRDLSKEGF